MTINRGAIGDLVNQQFSKIFDDAVTSVEPKFTKFLKVEDSKYAAEYLSGATGLPLHQIKTEGNIPTSGELAQKYNATFTHTTYGLYTRITQEAQEDDLSGRLKNIPKLQAVSGTQTIETLAASLLDLSQTTTGPDGKVLCATDHPLVLTGGAEGNRPATNADISVSVLEAALSDYRSIVDDAGNPMGLMPKYLTGAGSQEFVFAQFLKNPDQYGTGNRNMNAIKSERDLQYYINDYITDTDSWYLHLSPTDPRYQLLFFWRVPMSSQMMKTADGTGDSIFSSRFRCSMGWVDWRGIYGSVGA
jgi:hypothetical protein